MMLSDFPEIAAMWHPTKNGDMGPESVTAECYRKAHWLCPKSGGEYTRPVCRQVKAGTSTPYSTNRKVLQGYNDLATIHPDIAALWHPTKNGELTPEMLVSGSGTKVYWICPKSGSEYFRSVYDQVNHGTESPYTLGKIVLSGYNDLATTHPDIAALWHPTKNGELTPEMVMPGSGRRVHWVCPESGGEYTKRVLEQVEMGASSGFMSRKGGTVLSGYNDIGTTHPEVAAMWHPTKNNDLTCDMVLPGSAKTVWWLCPVTGAPYSRVVREQVRIGPSSPYMTGAKVLVGYNDLATIHPDIAALWHPTKNGGLTPGDVFPGSEKHVWWLCPETKSKYSRSVDKQVQCGIVSPYMTGSRVLEGHNDLQSTHPDIAQHWHPTLNGDLTPRMVSAGSTQKIWWVCPETGDFFERTVSLTVFRGATSPKVSSGEQEVYDFVKSLNLSCERSNRTIIRPLELDIVIPDRKIAIEYNGVYWHSERFGKDRKYHYNKWLAAKEAGYQLISIWEDDWRDRPEVVKSMLRRKLGVDDSPTIGARKCTVVELFHKDCAAFLDQHHIQGSSTGSLYLGLQDKDGNLIAASSWTKSGEILRLDRFATSCKVPGGMGKLLSKACQWGRNQGLHRIVTFSDHDVSDGSLYDNLGFIREAELNPDYKYVRQGTRCHKFGFRLKRFRTDPSLKYKEGMTEKQLAEMNNLYRVWDSGKTRHVLML